MRNLTNGEKGYLDNLINDKGYKLLLEIIKDFENVVLQGLKNINLADTEQLKILNAKQNYLKGLEDLVKTIESKTNKIGKRDFNNDKKVGQK